MRPWRRSWVAQAASAQTWRANGAHTHTPSPAKRITHSGPTDTQSQVFRRHTWAGAQRWRHQQPAHEWWWLIFRFHRSAVVFYFNMEKAIWNLEYLSFFEGNSLHGNPHGYTQLDSRPQPWTFCSFMKEHSDFNLLFEHKQTYYILQTYIRLTLNKHIFLDFWCAVCWMSTVDIIHEKMKTPPECIEILSF